MEPLGRSRCNNRGRPDAAILTDPLAKGSVLRPREDRPNQRVAAAPRLAVSSFHPDPVQFAANFSVAQIPPPSKREDPLNHGLLVQVLDQFAGVGCANLPAVGHFFGPRSQPVAGWPPTKPRVLERLDPPDQFVEPLDQIDGGGQLRPIFSHQRTCIQHDHNYLR